MAKRSKDKKKSRNNSDTRPTTDELQPDQKAIQQVLTRCKSAGLQPDAITIELSRLGIDELSTLQYALNRKQTALRDQDMENKENGVDSFGYLSILKDRWFVTWDLALQYLRCETVKMSWGVEHRPPYSVGSQERIEILGYSYSFWRIATLFARQCNLITPSYNPTAKVRLGMYDDVLRGPIKLPSGVDHRDMEGIPGTNALVRGEVYTSFASRLMPEAIYDGLLAVMKEFATSIPNTGIGNLDTAITFCPTALDFDHDLTSEPYQSLQNPPENQLTPTEERVDSTGSQNPTPDHDTEDETRDDAIRALLVKKHVVTTHFSNKAAECAPQYPPRKYPLTCARSPSDDQVEDLRTQVDKLVKIVQGLQHEQVLARPMIRSNYEVRRRNLVPAQLFSLPNQVKLSAWQSSASTDRTGDQVAHGPNITSDTTYGLTAFGKKYQPEILEMYGVQYFDRLEILIDPYGTIAQHEPALFQIPDLIRNLLIVACSAVFLVQAQRTQPMTRLKTILRLHNPLPGNDVMVPVDFAALPVAFGKMDTVIKRAIGTTRFNAEYGPSNATTFKTLWYNSKQAVESYLGKIKRRNDDIKNLSYGSESSRPLPQLMLSESEAIVCFIDTVRLAFIPHVNQKGTPRASNTLLNISDDILTAICIPGSNDLLAPQDFTN